MKKILLVIASVSVLAGCAVHTRSPDRAYGAYSRPQVVQVHRARQPVKVVRPKVVRSNRKPVYKPVVRPDNRHGQQTGKRSNAAPDYRSRR